MKQKKPDNWNLNHWTCQRFREQMSKTKLRAMLLHWGDNIIRNGDLCYIKTKHIAAGIYNVWFETTSTQPEKNPRSGEPTNES